MRRPLSLIPSLFAVALLASASFIGTSAVSAAPIAGAPATYCGDPDTDPSMSTGAGTMITCDTAITNTITAIDPGTGVATGTSVVRVTECTGPASGRLDPAFLTCTTNEQNLVLLVRTVEQCDGVGYGGGNVLDCRVSVINNFAGVTPQVIGAATVNQCNGSAPVTTGCNPFPASTTNATITQCNGSSYGGGQQDFNCTASGTSTASLSVTVNQCNGSNYGGGSWLNCSATLSNNLVTLATATPTLAPSATAIPTLAPTATPTPTSSPTLTATAAPSGSPTLTAEATPTVAPFPTPPDTSTALPSRPGGSDPLAVAGILVLMALLVGKVSVDRRRGV